MLLWAFWDVLTNRLAGSRIPDLQGLRISKRHCAGAAVQPPAGRPWTQTWGFVRSQESGLLTPTPEPLWGPGPTPVWLHLLGLGGDHLHLPGEQAEALRGQGWGRCLRGWPERSEPRSFVCKLLSPFFGGSSKVALLKTPHKQIQNDLWRVNLTSVGRADPLPPRPWLLRLRPTD